MNKEIKDWNDFQNLVLRLEMNEYYGKYGLRKLLKQEIQDSINALKDFLDNYSEYNEE